MLSFILPLSNFVIMLRMASATPPMPFAQRTRAYESDIDIQRGLLLGLDFEPASLTLNVFNLDRSDPIWIVSLSAGW